VYPLKFPSRLPIRGVEASDGFHRLFSSATLLLDRFGAPWLQE
jgi:hypothetical protein